MVSLSLDRDNMCKYIGDQSEGIDFTILPVSDFKKLIDRVAEEVVEEKFSVNLTDFVVEKSVYNIAVEEACDAV